MEKFIFVLMMFLVTLILYTKVLYNNRIIRHKYKIQYKTIYFLFLLFFLIYFSCRAIYVDDGVHIGGADAIVYKGRFEEANLSLFQSIKKQEYEPGYAILVYIVRLFTDNFTVFLVVYYLIVFLLIGYSLNRINFKSGIVSFSLIFIFIVIPLFDSMNLMRNMLAYFIALSSFLKMSKRKYSSGIILALLATSIHISAIILVPVFLTFYILSAKSIRKIKNTQIGFLLCLVFIFLSIYSAIFLLKPFILTTKYSMYFNTQGTQFAYGMFIERLSVVFLFFFINKKRNINNRGLLDYGIITTIFGLAFTLLQIEVPILYRVNMICSIGSFFTLVMLNNSYSCLKQSNCKRFIYATITLLLLVFKISSLVTDSIDNYSLLPHYYIWEEGLI